MNISTGQKLLVAQDAATAIAFAVNASFHSDQEANAEKHIAKAKAKLGELANALGHTVKADTPSMVSLQDIERRIGASVDKSLGNMAARAQEADHYRRRAERAEADAAEAQRDLAQEREISAELRDEIAQLTAMMPGKRRAFA